VTTPPTGSENPVLRGVKHRDGTGRVRLVDVWESVRAGLAAVAEHNAVPAGGRLGAVLVLLRDPGDGDLEFVFTRRREDLRSHPGQISFAGGRVDPGETPEQAAVREAVEEVNLKPESVEVLGRLPAFYIPPSRFWMHAVVARWRDPHPLIPAEDEVAEVLLARQSTFAERSRWRTVELSSGGFTWAWQLDDGHVLWGATAVVTSVVLGLIDPEWSGGVGPGELGTELHIRPWEDAPAPRVPRARLPGLPDIALADVPTLSQTELAGSLNPALIQRVGRAAAAAIMKLFPEASPGATEGLRPLVLVGPGGNGAVGAAAARALAAQGVTPTVIASRPESLSPSARADLEGLPISSFDGTLPPADVVLDALLGGGTNRRLASPELDLVLALRLLSVPVVSVDLPSGVDPMNGLMGEAVTADVTILIEGIRPGLLGSGIEPFAGDLYLVSDEVVDEDDSPPLRRVLRRPGAGWRE